MNKEVDVIVIGAGPGGASAAIKLAQAGKNVVLLDRGMPIGSKNLSGGVYWGDDLAEVLPNWKEEAPIDRFVVKKRVSFLAERDSMNIDFAFEDFKESKVGSIVLRAKFDEWLATKAKEAGVSVYSGINVDRLLVEDGKVVGIESNGESLKAPITIIMDGANSRLTLEAGLRDHKKMSETKKRYMLGVKEVIQLDEDIINERFSLETPYGFAAEYIMGNTPVNVMAGGFFYTNRNTISLGVVIHLSSLTSNDRSYEIFEMFKNHPHIKELIKGGEMLEYGAHLIPDDGYNMMPKLYGDGFLVGGDAAGFVFSNGLMIQGMNYATKSGILAAEAAIEALEKRSFTEETLKIYKTKLEKSYVLKDLKKFRDVRKMTANPVLFHKFPAALTGAFKEVFTQTGEPKQRLYKTLLKSFKKQGLGLLRLAREARKGMKL